MNTGTVISFSDSKGFGYIKADSTGEELFVHYSAIESDGYKTLSVGDRVDFEVFFVSNNLRNHARAVKKLGY